MPPPLKNNHTPQRGNTGNRERLWRIMLSAHVKVSFPHGKQSPDRAQPPDPARTPQLRGADTARRQPQVQEKGFIPWVCVRQISAGRLCHGFTERSKLQGSPPAACPELRVGFRDLGSPAHPGQGQSLASADPRSDKREDSCQGHGAVTNSLWSQSSALAQPGTAARPQCPRASWWQRQE